jgi:hypothetical protein
MSISRGLHAERDDTISHFILGEYMPHLLELCVATISTPFPGKMVWMGELQVHFEDNKEDVLNLGTGAGS